MAGLGNNFEPGTLQRLVHGLADLDRHKPVLLTPDQQGGRDDLGQRMGHIIGQDVERAQQQIDRPRTERVVGERGHEVEPTIAPGIGQAEHHPQQIRADHATGGRQHEAVNALRMLAGQMGADLAAHRMAHHMCFAGGQLPDKLGQAIGNPGDTHGPPSPVAAVADQIEQIHGEVLFEGGHIMPPPAAGASQTVHQQQWRAAADLAIHELAFAKVDNTWFFLTTKHAAVLLQVSCCGPVPAEAKANGILDQRVCATIGSAAT